MTHHEHVDYIPEGYHTVTPYLLVEDVDRLVKFLEQAFDAEATDRMERPDGSVMHAEVRIGDSVVMMGQVGPGEGPYRTLLYLYVEDADQYYRRALEAGAKTVQEPRDEFYGDRTAAVSDASGNQWWLATRKEVVSDEEMQRRVKDLESQGQ